MAPYSYSQLSTENQEIRIISLLPGQYEEPIRIVITHESLDFPKIDRPPRSFTQEEIRSVPDGWTLRETLSGHILYVSLALLYSISGVGYSWKGVEDQTPETMFIFAKSLLQTNSKIASTGVWHRYKRRASIRFRHLFLDPSQLRSEFQ